MADCGAPGNHLPRRRVKQASASHKTAIECHFWAMGWQSKGRHMSYSVPATEIEITYNSTNYVVTLTSSAASFQIKSPANGSLKQSTP